MSDSAKTSDDDLAGLAGLADDEALEAGAQEPSEANTMDVIYDGACEVCRREVHRLRRRGYRNAMRFVDASDPMSHLRGVAADEMLERVHAPTVESDEAEAGVQAIRAGGQESDYGFLMAVTRVPGLSHGLVLGYRAIARSRRWLGSAAVAGATSATSTRGASKLITVN